MEKAEFKKILDELKEASNKVSELEDILFKNFTDAELNETLSDEVKTETDEAETDESKAESDESPEEKAIDETDEKDDESKADEAEKLLEDF